LGKKNQEERLLNPRKVTNDWKELFVGEDEKVWGETVGKVCRWGSNTTSAPRTEDCLSF
jgi:hypothetical protein